MSDPPSKLRQAFLDLPLSQHGSQWDTFWRSSFSPWDRDGPSTALSDLLLQRADLVPPAQDRDQRGNLLRTETGSVARKTALVPGCGRGHDVLLLASFGYDVWGLDVSEKALDEARAHQEGKKSELKPVEDFEMGKVSWVSGDFFGDEWTRKAGVDKFDLIFDYTFLCALPPSARPSWAHRMSTLLSPHGRLICLEFPTGKPLSQQGPPWGVSPEVYEALLGAPGEEVSYDQEGGVVSTPSPKPRDDALHRLCLVKPLRTHAAGTKEDGTVVDFISVWSS